jgi:WD40 repeat protein
LLYANYSTDDTGGFARWSVSAASRRGAAIESILEGSGYPLAFSQSGTRLIALDADLAHSRPSVLYTVDLQTGTVTDVPPNLMGHQPYLDWAPDDDTLTVSFDGNLYLLDLFTGRARPVLDCRAVDHGGCSMPIWSPDRERIAITLDWSRSGPLDPRTGTYLIEAECFFSPTGCPFAQWQRVAQYGLSAWSPDGSQFAVAGYHAVSIIDATDLATIREIPLDPPMLAESLEWSPQSGVLAIRSQDQIYLFRTDGFPHPALLDTVPGMIGPIQWLVVPPSSGAG